ncbi:hypothetical protein OG738_28155 [Amycolatopsis sp. NBC_01488]|uniref:hypothetical protein n=1 Tax=Amycolatopsis sp. NBC_01488 TaxID=2903563 RepID=UPI002E283159|nr:hypothetical protein [Amycolatopsis sp. NBC_01488]
MPALDRTRTRAGTTVPGRRSPDRVGAVKDSFAAGGRLPTGFCSRTVAMVSLARSVGLGPAAPERGAVTDGIVDTVNSDDDVDRRKAGTTVPA